MWSVELPLEGLAGELRILSGAGDGIREGGRYYFRVASGARQVASIEPAELFTSVPDDPNSGDFRPQQCVGDVRVIVRFDDRAEAWTSIEVLPTKLEYEVEYRSMLEQIADRAAEAVLQGFAPSSLDAGSDPSGEAETSYRPFAFLVARFRDQGFQAALEKIRAQPHRDWRSLDTRRALGGGLAPNASLGRSLSRSRLDRTPPEHLSELGFKGMPAMVVERRTEDTYDTAPNRFVRHVVLRWQAIARLMLERLRTEKWIGAGPRGRGVAEAEWLIERCDEVLAFPAMRQAGPLTMFPAGDQTLLRRPGYRDVLRAFGLAEATMSLEAVLPDDVFSATQRNVAALYEYWCFIALADAISAEAGSAAAGVLFKTSANGLSLVLQQGEASKLEWELEVDGRSLGVELWFNRTFTRGADPRAEESSWARQLRPDASLRVRPLTARPSEASDPEMDVWLHFDAKYRIASMRVDESVDGDEEADENGQALQSRKAKREDLLKMHAYRDAIRRSAGAYVLYPGSGPEDLRSQYHELLPGIGAFPLRPDDAGAVDGVSALRSFILDVMTQVANQASTLERTQFWTARHVGADLATMEPVGFLPQPPADALVLIGYVRSDQQDWIERTGQYNLRAGDRRGSVGLGDALLGAETLVLWTHDDRRQAQVVGIFRRSSEWRIASAEALMDEGYPSRPTSNVYLVAEVSPLSRGGAIDGVMAAIDVADTAPRAGSWSTIGVATT